MIDSNKGEKGIPSIRLNGKRIEDLPIAESAGAQSQLPTVRETERQNRIAVVLSRYPRGSLAYYESRVRESRENISRMARTRSGLQHKIEEYQNTGTGTRRSWPCVMSFRPTMWLRWNSRSPNSATAWRNAMRSSKRNQTHLRNWSR